MNKKLCVLIAVAMLSMFAMTACSDNAGTSDKVTPTPGTTTITPGTNDGNNGTTIVPTTDPSTTTNPTTNPTTAPKK